MAFQVSPGVEVKEIDATNVIPVTASTTIGGTVGFFKFGPVEEIITVQSEKQLVEKFGAPDDADTAACFLPAAGFLKYASNLQVVRQSASDMLNAQSASGGTGVLIKNRSDYGEGDKVPDASTAAYYARYPGALGNSLKVITCVASASNTIFLSTAMDNYRSYFNGPPTTSAYAENLNSATDLLDEMHIIVIDEDGFISGVAGTVLETFGYVSQASDAKKEDGSSNFFKDVIDNTSQYLFTGAIGANRPTAAGKVASIAGGTYTAVNAQTAVSALSFTEGQDGTYSSTNTATTITALFNDALSSNISFLFATEGAVGSASSTAVNGAIIGVANTRKDCIGFISPPVFTTKTHTVAGPAADLVTYFNQTAVATSSSYCVADSSSLYVYDKYNDEYRYIIAAGHLAGVFANSDRVADPWFSPAGQTRGQILGVTKLAFNPTKVDRDTLYTNRINPIVSLPGSGLQLYGDKTRLNKPSAFDRVNVRRLFIVLEKAISNASEAMLFEFNDEFTRANFRNMVEPFLRDVKGRRGITDFLVVCDETNNDGQVIDTNSFVADIYIKPARSINFITLNFIATRTGVEFSEIAG